MPQHDSTRLKAASKYLVVLAALLVFIGWILNTPPGLLGRADAIGYAVCHRIDARSFHIGSRQLPLCARCSSMYLGAVIGLAYQMVFARKRSGTPHWSVIIPLVLFVLAFGIDGSNSYLYLIKETYPDALARLPNLYEPNNTLRLLTGSGMGLGIAAMLFPAFNQTMWKDADDRRVFPDLKSFAPLFGLTLLLDLLVLTENPVVLYPVAFISVGGVLILLMMVYSMIWVMLMRLENEFTRFSQLWLVLAAGFTIAMLQIAAIDLLRFWLTGTWGGFSLS
ncbi:MAG: DUF2085 domain-containing protein [Anaerolineales bacterium]|nr:DUF2085 domain-containing protein [Anaerolineales bacterium]